MQRSAGHDLTRDDPGDLPRCPMERLADRFNDCPKPVLVEASAVRTALGNCILYLEAELSRVDQIDDLINFLAAVKERAK